ncbi:related to C6 transcription factor (PrnA) [Cephalotrichum gorgonifer]|uniref:Related to C6 transcription factor (PrnA) n=1 Tax=Cephalotrichum gorgonifer TaxID=2041049 RepID=A0AAE8MU15_9PEZI|nr:related to C6 transcription factor (PrnA) [Cephalotrichum gorgonifer]
MEPPPPNLHRQKQRRVPERERKRVVRACDGCRRQKERCDGGVPCRRCVRLRRQCGFLSPPMRQPNPSPGPSASSARAPSRDSEELTKRVGYMERLLRHYIGDINLDLDNLHRLSEAVNDKDRLTARGEEPGSGESDFTGVEKESFTVQPLENNTTHYSGEFSHWNFSMRIKQWIEECVPEQGRNDAPGVTNFLNFKEYYRAEELQSSEAFTALASLPPRHIANFLVQVFFKHARTNYVYVEKAWLLDKIDVAYENAASLSRRDVGTVCIIFIVLAIGTQYAYLERLAESGPGDNPAQDAAGPFSEDSIGIMFYQQACRLVPDVITSASLESAQACLLIGIYTLPLDASGLSYIYLNLAVKLGIQNGMHRRYTGEGFDPALRETRNRVWWAAYTMERRVGIFHGRPVSIPSADVDAEMPVQRPDDPPAHVAAMLATLQLHDILGKISREISGLRTQTKQGAIDTLGRLVDLKNAVHGWWHSLPHDAFCKDPAPHSCVDRAGMHLKLEFCLVRMFTGRPFISPQAHPRNSSSSSSSSGSSSSLADRAADSRSILVSDCVAAALAVIDACKVLRGSVGLARASYTEFSACRAAVLVIVTQCLQERTEALRQSLRDGVAMIKIMSAGGESARSEASLIEVFERAILRLYAAAGVGSSAESDYARFKQWEMLWKISGSPGPGANAGTGAGAGVAGARRRTQQRLQGFPTRA